MPLLPALDDLQAAIRLSSPNMSVLGLDLSRDLLQTLGNAETISRQMGTSALVDDDEPSHGERARRVQQLREHICATLPQLVALEARVRERDTELNDGLDACLGLISKAVSVPPGSSGACTHTAQGSPRAAERALPTARMVGGESAPNERRASSGYMTSMSSHSTRPVSTSPGGSTTMEGIAGLGEVVSRTTSAVPRPVLRRLLEMTR